MRRVMPSATNSHRIASIHRPAATSANFTSRRARSRSKCASRHSRPPSCPIKRGRLSSATCAAISRLRKPLSRCTWPGFRCAGCRTLPKRSAALGCLPVRYPKLLKKVYQHIERWRSQKMEGEFAYISRWHCAQALLGLRD